MSHPIPNVARLINRINSATTIQGLLQLATSWRNGDPDWTILVPADQETVRRAWVDKRSALHGIGGTTGSLAQTLASVASETADTTSLHSTAGGGGVSGAGFRDHTGYLVALQRGGLQPHTRAQYLATVIAAGLATADTFPPANAPIGTVGRGVTHIASGTGPGFIAQRNARRRAARATDHTSPEGRAAAIALARANGACLAGYDGQVIDPATGDIGTIVQFGRLANKVLDEQSGRYRQALIPWGDVETVRQTLKLSKGAFGRSPGSVGLLGDATQILNNGGYVARRIKANAIPSFDNAAVMVPVRSAWKIGFFDNRADSDSMGQREATIALVKQGSDLVVICDNPNHEGAAKVIADYHRRVAETLIPSDDLLTRVEAAFRRECGARSTDLGLYVSPAMSARAVDMANALRPIIGRNVYAYAHTHAESISAALTDSVDQSITTFEASIEKPGYKAGPTAIGKVETLRTEIAGLAGLLGVAAVKSYRDRLDALDAKLVKMIGDASDQRAMMLELD